jgi:hypothetical protein
MSAPSSDFGTPERQSDQTFFVPFLQRKQLNTRVTITAEGITPTLEYQDVFQSHQAFVLNKLVSNRQLYKSQPTLESLQYMTPVWGFMKTSGGQVQLAKSMIIRNNIPASKWPCVADFVLIGLKISRSLIQPVFDLVFVESVTSNVIDFDWGIQAADVDASHRDREELEEVSDVSFMDTASGGAMKIKDPAVLAREKAEAKERVRDAYRAAQAAREAADTLASQFYTSYDVSDTESAFSEWADLESDSDSDDGASR